MKFVILEDETPAYELLARKLRMLVPNAWIYPQVFSVEEAVAFFRHESSFSLVFADIHLQDGMSFDALQVSDIPAPVVFVTAHDGYLMHAFEHNSIAYLLKPVDTQLLSKTLDKFYQLRSLFTANDKPFKKFIKENSSQRIIVRRGTDFQLLPAEEIVFIFTESKLVFAVDKDKKKYVCDENNLADLLDKLDEEIFFRANRQYIININFIDRFYSDERSRIVIVMNIDPPEKIIVSQENAAIFRKWIGKMD